MNTQTDDLRSFLRAGTAEDHAALDARFIGMLEEEGPALYHAFVRMNEACHALLEPEIASALGETADADERRNLQGVLALDLQAMDLSPVRCDGPGPLTAGEAVGAVYVLDGSRMGARFILREFKAGGIGQRWPGSSTHYLTAAAAPDPFRDRMRTLSADMATSEERQAALRGARRAFAFFHSVLDMVSGTPSQKAICA